MSDQPDRRAFLKGLGTVGATGVAAMVPIEAAEPRVAARQAAPIASDPVSHAFKGNRMAFAGIADKPEREDLIAYLERATRPN